LFSEITASSAAGARCQRAQPWRQGISLVAAIPGRYTGPASRTYLYYTDEHKHWVEGLKVTIKPRLGP